MKGSIRVIALGLCASVIFLSALGSASGAEPSWHLQESPNGSGETTANSLNDVACLESPAPPFYTCIAVGSTTSSGSTKPLIEFTGGSGVESWYTWEAGFGPLPSTAEYPGAVLEAISCKDSTHCMAVGYYTPKAGTRRPFAERWTYAGLPTEWQIEKPAIPGTDEFTELTGVSCLSTGTCEAVGTTKATSGSTSSKTLAEKWNGSWAVETSASTAGVENRLTDVSCVASTSCMAVGRVGTTTLSESYNGTEWKQAGVNSTGSFEGVSCTSSSACTAVGAASSKIIARRWNGTSWAAQSPVVPAGSTLSTGADVSCLTATECVVAGHYNDSGGASHPLAEHWNGTAWSLDSVPAPKGSTAATLFGVSCRAATLCVAVGNATLTGTKTLGEIYL
jgi:hypothetical protein